MMHKHVTPNPNPVYMASKTTIHTTELHGLNIVCIYVYIYLYTHKECMVCKKQEFKSEVHKIKLMAVS